MWIKREKKAYKIGYSQSYPRYPQKTGRWWEEIYKTGVLWEVMKKIKNQEGFWKNKRLNNEEKNANCLKISTIYVNIL